MATPEKPYYYRAHGLEIQSDIPLHNVLPVDRGTSARSPDAVILRGEVLPAAESDGATQVQPGETFHIRSAYGSVRIGHTRVHVCPVEGILYDELLSYFAVYVVAILLHLRGLLTLHASAVEIDGMAVAFIGEKGMGKSTTASYLVAQGHRLLSDDLIACGVDGGDPGVHVDPGFPYVKVFPEVLANVPDQQEGSRDWILPGSRKKVVPLSAAEHRSEVPLARLYVLAFHEGDEVILNPIPQKRAFLFVMAQSFVQRLTTREIRYDGQYFSDCAALARQVPVAVLGRPQTLEALPPLYEMIRDDVCSHA
jgi:hypothetical protein